MFKDYRVKCILFSVVCGVWYFIGKSVQKLQGTDYMMFSVVCCVWCLHWFTVNTVQRLYGTIHSRTSLAHYLLEATTFPNYQPL